MKIGLISNPLSRANRKNGGVAARVTPSRTIFVAQPSCHNQLLLDLIRFSKEGVELIVIDGGDGTVRDIISNIHHAYGSQWPLFALLPSGKTNVIAGQVGHFGSGYKGWQRLLEKNKLNKLQHRRTNCPALEICWPERSEPVKRGFLLGLAAFSDGVQIANETIHPIGIVKGLAVAMAIIGVLRRNMFTIKKKNIVLNEKCQIFVNGRHINGDRHFLVLVSSLKRLTFGLKPFRGEGRGLLNWLDISAPPRHIFIGIFLLVLGIFKTWMKQNGYLSGRAETIDIKSNHQFVLDGELYNARGHIKIVATQPIGFLGQ